jgi:hypothetical protein
MAHEPEGNMTELIPNIDNEPLPGKAVCQPEHVDEALAQVRAEFAPLPKNLNVADGVPLLLIQTQMQQQQ